MASIIDLTPGRLLTRLQDVYAQINFNASIKHTQIGE